MSDPVLDTEDVVGTVFALRELTASTGKLFSSFLIILEIAGEKRVSVLWLRAKSSFDILKGLFCLKKETVCDSQSLQYLLSGLATGCYKEKNRIHSLT